MYSDICRIITSNSLSHTSLYQLLLLVKCNSIVGGECKGEFRLHDACVQGKIVTKKIGDEAHATT